MENFKNIDHEIECAKNENKPAHFWIYLEYFDKIEKIIREKIFTQLKDGN